MKRLILLAFGLCLGFALGAYGGEVVKTDGEVVTGQIEDLQLNDYIRLRTKEQKLVEIRWNEIKKLNGKEVAVPQPAPAKREFWQKSWYLDLFEGGAAGLGYPQEMCKTLDSFRDAPGTDYVGPLKISVLGIYFPVGASRKTLVGFTMNDSSDIISGLSNHTMVEEYLVSLAAMYFPLGKIGDGLFVRGELGTAEVLFAGDRGDGWGFLTGVGYAFRMGRMFRPMVNWSYCMKSINSNTGKLVSEGIYHENSVMFGLLW